MGPSWKKSSGSVFSAGAVGTSLNLLNISVGLVFQAALAAMLGVAALADAFQVSWTIVTFVAVVQFTMVLSLLVPRLGICDSDGVISTNGSNLPLALGVTAGLSQAAVAPVVTTGDLRTLLLASASAHLFVGASAVPQALAFISRRFAVAGIGPIANGIALLTVTLACLGRLNAMFLGLAVTVGYAAQWLVTFMGTRDLKCVAGPSAISTRLFIGVLGFTLVSKFQPVLERIISYQLGTGTTAALGYAQKITQGLVIFATFGFATAATASLAHHAKQGEFKAAAELLSRVSLVTLFFGSVVCALALPAAYPATVILFERGAFTHTDSLFVTNVVFAQLPWVWAGALAGVVSTYLYSTGKYIQLLIVGIISLAVTLGCGIAFSGSVPKYAVAIASSSGMVASLGAALTVLSRTAVWSYYWPSLLERWRLVACSFGAIAASVAVYASLRLLVGEPSLNECLAATLITAVSILVIFFTAGISRNDLVDIADAKLH